jgi:CDGSH-type Zn-finger protein
MAREVRHEAQGPDVLDESDLGDDGKIYVCRCGLSEEKPLCDGSHNQTADEDDDTVYRYDGPERRAVEALEFADE